MDVDEHGTPDKKGKVTKITASQCGHWKGQISSSSKGAAKWERVAVWQEVFMLGRHVESLCALGEGFGPGEGW